ncbi:MAG TPA: hypothetical protein VJ859_13830 [Allosphingosinicella sp.]|nr:hypothetical protein [Allosphingosinicella sp.]
MSTAEEYQAKADDALAKLGEAKSDAERLRLRRAHSAYTKLASHGAEAAARAALKPAPRIVPEKPTAGKQARPLDSFTLK